MSESRLGVGAPLDNGPVEQLKARSKAFSEKSRNTSTLTFLTANKPWIRLSSGVNELSTEEIEEVEKNGRLVTSTGNSKLAKETILGTLQSKSGLGDNNKKSPNPLYRKTSDLGYRPEPGITSATIRSKGSYGTLRETTVNFVVWSLEDLENIEKLFLRPGYSMLLEWGHSVYIDNTGALQTQPPTYGEDFFKTQNIRDIEAKIEELRKKADYNYDAVFGYVKNYNWSFRKDGGYDCSISIISKGTLIESLRVDVSSLLLERIPKSSFSTDTENAKEEQKSPFHFFFTKLKNNTGGEGKFTKRTLQGLKVLEKEGVRSTAVDAQAAAAGVLLLNRKTGETVSTNTLIEFLQPISDFTAYSKSITEPQSNKKELKWWIPLRTFLEIFNEYIGKSQFGDNRVEFYTGEGSKPGDNYTVINEFVTSNYHFGLDPLICIVPRLNEVPVEQTTITSVKALPITIIRSPLQVSTGTSADILNIYVNTDMLKEVVDSFIDAEQGQLRNALDMIKSVLSKINDNLGGVNDLDVHYEDSTNIHYIVDRKNTPSKSEGYPTVKLTGLESTITDLQLSSKLSNEVGSQIAIAAQGISENYTENIAELLKWNTGLVDRHTISFETVFRAENQGVSPYTAATGRPDPRDTNPTAEGPYSISPSLTFNKNSTVSKESEELTTASKQQEQEKTYLLKLNEVYKKLKEGTYDSTALSELKSYFRTYMSKYVLTQQIAEGNPEKGIVPIELSLSMLGISGITVAKAFKVEKGILPERITGRFGFIVTGIEHEIGNQWGTKIKTLFYTLQPPTENLIKGLDNYTKGQGTLPGTSTTTLQDPNFTGPTPNADRVRLILKSFGYLEKGKELSSGGDLSVETSIAAIAVLSTIKSELPDLKITLTGGNDSFHQKLNYNSRHKLGNAFDLIVGNSTPTNINRVETILFRYTAGNDPNFRFINEYSSPTKAATGKHFHISWGPGTEGAVNVAKAKKLAAEGKIKPIPIR